MKKIYTALVLFVWVLNLCLFSSLMLYIIPEPDNISTPFPTSIRVTYYPTRTPISITTPIFTATTIPTMTPFVLEPLTIPTTSHPVGTSGKCVDGTYTSAKNRRGACSYHGGIAEWWGN